MGAKPAGRVPQAVTDPEYWRRQIAEAGINFHLAVWKSPLRWLKHHNRRHRKILAKYVGPGDSVLDGGCAFGRTLDLLPDGWAGDYLGVDISPDFIALARRVHPGHAFAVGDLRRLDFVDRRYDWCVLSNVKHTIIGNAGATVWAEVERELTRVADRLLFLEWAVELEPDYGFPKVCHHEYERTLTPEQLDYEDWK